VEGLPLLAIKVNNRENGCTLQIGTPRVWTFQVEMSGLFRSVTKQNDDFLENGSYDFDYIYVIYEDRLPK
jgi:hypothetical protein